MPVNKGPLEKDIQRDICTWLDQHEIFFWRSNNVPVFSKSNDGVSRFRSLPKHTPRGLPDIMVIYNGRFVGLEVKRPGQKLKPAQADFGLALCTHGAFYFMVTSVEDVSRVFALGPDDALKFNDLKEYV